MRTLGVLLAGGRGRRLGLGVPKALATLGGLTLLEHALATLESLADEIVVCAPADMALPVEASRRVADPEPGAGPLAALVAGLAARPFERAIVLGVDLPFADRDALAALGGLEPGAIAIVPAPDARPQPLAAWYGSAARAPLAAALAGGARALVPAVLALPARIADDTVLASLPGGGAAYANVNTPEDLARAGRRIEQERKGIAR